MQGVRRLFFAIDIEKVSGIIKCDLGIIKCS